MYRIADIELYMSPVISFYITLENIETGEKPRYPYHFSLRGYSDREESYILTILNILNLWDIPVEIVPETEEHQGFQICLPYPLLATIQFVNEYGQGFRLLDKDGEDIDADMVASYLLSAIKDGIVTGS